MQCKSDTSHGCWHWNKGVGIGSRSFSKMKILEIYNVVWVCAFLEEVAMGVFRSRVLPVVSIYKKFPNF